MDNPYVVEIINILNQIKGWIFALIGVVTVVIVVKNRKLQEILKGPLLWAVEYFFWHGLPTG